MVIPDRFHRWSPAWRGAYRKGYEAGVDGIARENCPYDDKRKWDGRLTWSRAFRSCWHDGWEAGQKERKQRLTRTLERIQP